MTVCTARETLPGSLTESAGSYRRIVRIPFGRALMIPGTPLDGDRLDEAFQEDPTHLALFTTT